MILSEAIDKYVRRSQACGWSFTAGRRTLYSFKNHVGNLSLDCVAVSGTQAFLDGPRTSRATWRAKYALLKHFFEFWRLQGALPELPLPPLKPASRGTFTPYIYTKTEVRSLLIATRQCQGFSHCAMDSATFRCFLLTLYATGALVGEALNLRVGDVDFKRRRIALSGNRIIGSRSLPICCDLLDELTIFARFRHPKKRVVDRHFFCTKRGQPLIQSRVRARFVHLRQLVGIQRRDGVYYQPRMHDLRSTFAVHRITSWIKEGADLNRMLPALAAYLGVSGLQTTEQFLALTPEYFRKQLRKLSPQRGRRRWRDDPDLMRFLAGL
jgi:integrase/recombinase XerD